MKTTQLFKGANVFMSRNLVPPEVFDTLLDAFKLNGAEIFLCCDPSRSGPSDFHVIASPDHEKFKDLKAKGCNLIGPQCVLSCAKEGRPLPQGGFTCCLAMDGLKVLASGFQINEKDKIEELVTSMGGVMLSRVSSDVNFVIVKNVLAAKYKWALNIKKPVVALNWLHQCWNEHRVVPQEPYKILPFSGLIICVTKIPADERKGMEKLISEYGGRYSGELTRRCTHLIADAAEGDKYEVARKWGHIQIVTRKWFQQSIPRKVCLSEESYPVLGSIPLNRGVKSLGRHNGQEKLPVCPITMSPSAVAVTESSYAQSRDSDIEASASQNVFFASMNPSTDVKEPSEGPTTWHEQNIDGCTARDSESEDNDLYLSDCRIFLLGFEASELLRLVKLIRRGGGSRYMMLNERMTHIVVGTPSESEKRDARSVAASGVIQVVTPRWLEDCDREKKKIPIHKIYTAHKLILPRDGAPDDDEYDTEDSFIDDAELDEYFEVDNSAIKHDGFFVNRGKLERIEPSTTSNKQPKKRQRKEPAKSCSDIVDVSRKQAKMAKTAGEKDQCAAPGPSSKKKSNEFKTGQDSFPILKPQSGNDSLENVKHTDKANHQPRNSISPKSKAAGSSGVLHPKCNNKNAHQQPNSLPGKSGPNDPAKSIVVRQKQNNGMHDLDNGTKKCSSSARPKTSTLERAIKELERVVAESRPPATTENQDVDTSSQAVKRRLPRDVKLKLAKVARIEHARQGNLTGELINRLMSIVGHLIQVRSLKRNLKNMIDSGDSANREKDTRFLRIKNEVIEMLKTQVPLMESQAINHEAGTSDDFQDVDAAEKPPLNKNFVMDAALEDKLCDLYDVFVDGLDEDSGPQIRKLYANLADLWPSKLMDNHEIKRAICRAKERRRAFNGNLRKEMDQVKMTKRKQAQLVPKSDGVTYPDKAAGVGDKKRFVPSSTTTSLVHSQPTADPFRDSSKQQHERLKGTSGSSNPSGEAKTVRRKTEPSLEESHVPEEKPDVLALRQQTHPQTMAQAPPDLNLPS